MFARLARLNLYLNYGFDHYLNRFCIYWFGEKNPWRVVIVLILVSPLVFAVASPWLPMLVRVSTLMIMILLLIARISYHRQ